MARRRLSDTNAVAMPAGAERREYSSKSVRSVENGYIVSECTERDGNYSSREYFTKNPSRMEPQKAGSVGPEGLSGAISECNK